MRLLLDECVPARLRQFLEEDHEVSTVVQEGWGGVKNGAMLALAAHRFDALVTVDKNLPYQQNARSLPLAIVVLDSPSNALWALVQLLPDLEYELERLVPRSYVVVKAES